MDYQKCKVPELAPAIEHLSRITGVPCEINEEPGLKEMGLISLPVASEDLVRIASKYGLHETVATDVQSFFCQFVRVIQNLQKKGVFSESEFDRFFEE